MRLFRIVILAFVISSPVAAQTPTAGQLVGEWQRQGDTLRRITFKADSTFTFFNATAAQLNGKPQPIDLVARWQLTKDTLVFSQPRMKLGETIVAQGKGPAQQIFGNDTLRLLTLRGRVLTMKTRDGKRTYVYNRLGMEERKSAAKPERNNPLIEHP